MVSHLVAQSYIKRILLNERDVLKIAWIIIMGSALSQGALELSRIFPCLMSELSAELFKLAIPLSVTTKAQISRECTASAYSHSLVTALLFLVFIVTWLRFLWGDNRLLDAKYVEVLTFVDDGARDENNPELSNEFRKHFWFIISSFRRIVLVFDILFVIFHGIIFLLLAKNINNHDVFVLLYLFLLLFNALWLMLSWMASRRKYYDFWKSYINQDRIGEVTALKGPWRWAINNLVHAIILMLILINLRYFLVFQDDQYWFYASISSAAIFFSNCLLDFLLTWSVYFPRVSKIYKDLVGAVTEQ